MHAGLIDHIEVYTWRMCAANVRYPGRGESSPMLGVAVEEVTRLPVAGGLYLVRSVGSLHFFDLDALAYLRLPGDRSNTFPHDLAALRLTAVERAPAVSDSFFIWVDDPREFAVMDYWRQSSTISAIYHLLEVRPSPHSNTGQWAQLRDEHAAASPLRQPGVHQSDPDAAPVTEILPGLLVGLAREWNVTLSGDRVLNVDGKVHNLLPVLEWPLVSGREWSTLLCVYRIGPEGRLRLFLDVRRRTGVGSTAAIRSMRLVVGQRPTGHRSDERPKDGPDGS